MVRHKHEYAAVWSHLGPYGRQDVHLHYCQGISCNAVMVGEGRVCLGRDAPHEAKKLTISARSWQSKSNEGTALSRGRVTL